MSTEELLDSFKNALDDLGIGFRDSGQSLAVENCPECGRNKYKVLFRVVDVDDEIEDGQPFMGRCFSGSCGQNYSSVSYLLATGLDYGKASEIHGKNPERNYQKMALVAENFDFFKTDTPKEKEKPNTSKPIYYDASKFFKLELLGENHPITKYAKSRGYHPAMHNMIRGDISTGSVVFLCREPGTGKVIGYQKRFITVPPWGQKTDTAYGFDVSQNLFRLKNEKSPVVAVCEGPFTAVAARRFGFDAVSTFGSAMTDAQKKMIYGIYSDKQTVYVNKAKVLVAQEKDKAGAQYFNKLASFFYWKEEMQALGVVSPESGSDLNDAWMAGKRFSSSDVENYNPALPVSHFSLMGDL